MGGGASALLDAASELGLSHDQRKRYRGMYIELAKTGKTPKQIMAILNTKIEEEKTTGVPSGLHGKPGENARRSSNPKRVATAPVSPQNVVQFVLNSESNDTAAMSVESLSPSKEEPVSLVDDEIENILPKLLEGIEDTSINVECKLCKVSFETAAQLKRHINFSQLHCGNVKDYAAQRNSAIRAKRCANVVQAAINIFLTTLTYVRSQQAALSPVQYRWWCAGRRIIRQLRIQDTFKYLVKLYNIGAGTIPSDPFEVLFEGTKLFWRTQETLDIHMYLHHDAHTRSVTTGGVAVVQISGYNKRTKQEVERLFVSYEAVSQLIESQLRADLAAKSTKQEAVVRRKSLNNLLDAVDVTREMVAEYIQARLELAVVPSNVGKQKLVLSTSAAGVLAVSPYSTLTLNFLLGFGTEAHLRFTNPLFRNTSPLQSVKVPAALQSRKASTNQMLTSGVEVDEEDHHSSVQATIAAINATSAESQAHKLLSILIPPAEVWKLKQVNLPLWAIAKTLSGKARAIDSTIADLDYQKHELKEATNQAELHAAALSEQLAPFIANPHVPQVKKHKPVKRHSPKRGGLSMETLSSALHRKRRNSIG
jgi:hypothetical protein